MTNESRLSTLTNLSDVFLEDGARHLIKSESRYLQQKEVNLFNIDLHILLPQALYVDMLFGLDFAKCLVVVVGASFHLRS